VSTWRHWLDASDTRARKARVLTSRVVYVLKAVVSDWRKHTAHTSESPYDLSWDDVEVFWQESSCVAWVGSDSDDDATPATRSEAAVPSRVQPAAHIHPLLTVSDVSHWSSHHAPTRSGSTQFHIREMRAVPLSEVLLNFPAASVHMKPFDVAKLYVYAVAGCSVLQATYVCTIA
jgi:hypothetical protein